MIIPITNVQHLMLRHDVVEAVTAGQFHVYPVRTVDQAIELLTGIPAGERDEQGNHPEGSVNQLVQARLIDLAEKQSAFNAPSQEQEEKRITEDKEGEE